MNGSEANFFKNLSEELKKNNYDILFIQKIIKEIADKFENQNSILIQKNNSFKQIIKNIHESITKIESILEKRIDEESGDNLFDQFNDILISEKRVRNNLIDMMDSWDNIKEEEEDKNKEISSISSENLILENIRNINTFNEWITYLHQLKDGRLISCSTSGEVVIYKKNNFEIQQSIILNSGEINSLTELNDGYLIICCDQDIKLLKLFDNNKCRVEGTIGAHTNFIYKFIEIKKYIFVSISKDKTMKIWKINDNKNLVIDKSIEFQEKNSSSNILKINENEFVTSSFGNDWNIQFWNSNNIKLIKKIDLIPNWPRKNMCLLDDDTLCVGGSFYNGFYLIKISKHELIKQIIGYNVFSIIKYNDGTFLCGVEDEKDKKNYIVVCSYVKNNFEIKMEKKYEHSNHILSMVKLNDGTIISGGKNEEIKFWGKKYESTVKIFL